MSGITNMPIYIQIDGLSDADKEQLTMLFEQAARRMYNQVIMSKGKDYADTLKVYVTAGTPA